MDKASIGILMIEVLASSDMGGFLIVLGVICFFFYIILGGWDDD
jgi:hypothetical protein